MWILEHLETILAIYGALVALPAQDIYGIKESVYNKHWKCEAPLIIDARIKPQHQKQLTIPAEITTKAKQILNDAGVL